jgi:hypothetical protein
MQSVDKKQHPREMYGDLMSVLRKWMCLGADRPVRDPRLLMAHFVCRMTGEMEKVWN